MQFFHRQSNNSAPILGQHHVGLGHDIGQQTTSRIMIHCRLNFLMIPCFGRSLPCRRFGIPTFCHQCRFSAPVRSFSCFSNSFFLSNSMIFLFCGLSLLFLHVSPLLLCFIMDALFCWFADSGLFTCFLFFFFHSLVNVK